MLPQKFIYKFLSLLLSFIVLSKSAEIELTIEIDATRRECFHETIKQGVNVEFEYQVIDGGDMDINCHIMAPSGRTLISEMRKTESGHNFEAKEGGDYSFCLDNTFSRFSSKLVFFELIMDTGEDEEQFAGLPSEDPAALDIKVEDLKSSLVKIRDYIEKGKQIQNVLRAIETRDRSMQEDNFERVNFWSGVQVFVMVSVAITHVLMIRSLFEDKSKHGKDMKMRT